MPIYEYDCQTGGSRFELLVLEEGRLTCPSCESDQLERVWPLFSVSSDSTRSASLALARRAGATVRRDKDIAEREEMEHHHH
jgi:putative FmdB family regulatory protein